MAFYCVTMLAMAMELAEEDPAYEDVASKFFEHFVAIVDAMNRLGGTGLWDEADGFYYDQLQIGGRPVRLRIRSLVGIIPLLAVEVLDDQTIARLSGFQKRLCGFSIITATWPDTFPMGRRAPAVRAAGCWPFRRGHDWTDPPLCTRRE